LSWDLVFRKYVYLSGLSFSLYSTLNTNAFANDYLLTRQGKVELIFLELGFGFSSGGLIVLGLSGG